MMEHGNGIHNAYVNIALATVRIEHPFVQVLALDNMNMSRQIDLATFLICNVITMLFFMCL